METKTDMATVMAREIGVKSITLPAANIYSARVEKSAAKLFRDAIPSIEEELDAMAETEKDAFWIGNTHAYNGKGKGFWCSPFMEIDVGEAEPFIIATEMHDAESGRVVRIPFGMGMFCNGRIGCWMERDEKGRFRGKARPVELW